PPAGRVPRSRPRTSCSGSSRTCPGPISTSRARPWAWPRARPMPPGRRAMAWRCSTVSCATTTRAEPLSVTADPSPLLYWPMLFVTAGLAVLCAAPILLVLAGFVGVVHFELNMLFIALPALAACAALGVLAHGLLRD